MKENKLRARWSKSENDILLTYPLGRSTKCDGAFLAFNCFNDNFVKEMTARGYDIKTLKFEITVDENSDRYKDKFPSLAELGV